MRKFNLLFSIIILFAIACGTTPINQARYKEKIVDMVQKSKVDLAESKQQYRILSDTFSSFVMFTSTELINKYEDMEDQYEEAEDHHEDIQYWIDEIDERFNNLALNWREQLDQYGNNELRSQSLANLQQTQRQYQNYLQAMQSSELQMELLLDEYSNLLLYLGQNLNRSALANLEGDADQLRNQTDDLARQIDNTLIEADAFIQVLERNPITRQY